MKDVKIVMKNVENKNRVFRDSLSHEQLRKMTITISFGK